MVLEIWINLLLLLLRYLFGEGIGRGKVSVALAVDGGVCTSTNGIHLPVSVVIVHHMEITMPAPAFLHTKNRKLIIKLFIPSLLLLCQTRTNLMDGWQLHYWNALNPPKQGKRKEVRLWSHEYITLAFSEWDLRQNGCKQL